VAWDSWRGRKLHFGWTNFCWKYLKYVVIYAAIIIYFYVLHNYHQQWSEYMLNIKPEFYQTGRAPVDYYAIITGLT
jgi:hypothetical protein